MDPDLPDELNDRARDNWRGLTAIGDVAGWDWPLAARRTAVALAVSAAEADEPSKGIILLRDISRLFAMRARAGVSDPDRISSSALANALGSLQDRPWATWLRGREITSAQVAKLLRPFRVMPRTIKLADGSQPNGYKVKQFADAFRRYLS